MYCGSTNESIVSLNNSMQVVFNTDQNREFKGFLVTYKTGKVSSSPTKQVGLPHHLQNR